MAHIFVMILSVWFLHTLKAFDWEIYLKKYPYLLEAGIKDWGSAMCHYLNAGLRQGFSTANEPVPRSNFDWEYYVRHNKLLCTTEQEASKHYQKVGFFDNLSYCKPFTIVILLHLHNLNLMDEFIDQINYFMRINSYNKYYIKITIPVDTNITSFFSNQENDQKLSYVSSRRTTNPHENMRAVIDDYQLMNDNNCNTIHKLVDYLIYGLNIDADRLQIILSPNKGRDIGGFFIALDRVIKEHLEHDYIIKLHTKTWGPWRKLLMSFLNVHINPLLRKNECIYSNRITFNYTEKTCDTFRGECSLDQWFNYKHMKDLLTEMGLEQRNFSFCGGSMFIVSHKMTEFFKRYDLKLLYDKLNDEGSFGNARDGLIEHAYERFFGYLVDYLGLKTCLLDYCPLPYPNDNSIAKTCQIINEYPIDEVRKIVKSHNIKTMAIYFPQFHEFEENNKFWGNGFTEWTLLKKYQGEIKHPHFDLGYYDMLEYTTRKKQAIIAKKYGVSSFCYYHYWFKDKKVMYKGVEKILEDGEPDIPFIFCWANEPWTRNWDGSAQEILIPQEYGNQEDWIKHYEYLSRFFKHPNYIKENNCPIFIVYRISHVADNNALSMFALWREMALKDGFNGLKVMSMCNYFEHGPSTFIGFDGIIEHQPGCGFEGCTGDICLIDGTNLLGFDQENFYTSILNQHKWDKHHIYGIFYGFDNSSRRINKSSHKFINLSYKAFESYLQKTLMKSTQQAREGDNFILLNAWNEWSEQAMFEPNDHDGYELLKIIQKYFV